MWSLLGAKLRLHNAAGFSCAPSAALLALVILLSLPAAQSSAVARDAADRSQTSDANQPDYNAGQSAYATGRFVEALRIWRPLAESGDPRAAFGLGLLYDLGEGVGQDAAAAYVWYRTAAEAGVVAAEFNIAVMCDSGVGTARNAAEAAVWYARAAAHGIARAEYNLAQLYAAGDGVPRNLDVAKAGYAAAAAHGLSAASSKLALLRETSRRCRSARSCETSIDPRSPCRTSRRSKIKARRRHVRRIVLGRAGANCTSELFCAGCYVGHGRRPSHLQQLSESVSDSSAAAIDTRCICLARLYGRGLGDRLRAERMELFLPALSVTFGRCSPSG